MSNKVLKDYLSRPGTSYGETSIEGIQEIYDRAHAINAISAETVFLDIGSGKGEVVNSFKNISGITRSVGIEMQDIYYSEAVSNYPTLEFHNNVAQNKLDIIAEADIIFTNNISIPSEMFWSIYKSIKTGAIVVYNGIQVTPRLKYAYDYDKSEITKFNIIANNMSSEFHMFTKK